MAQLHSGRAPYAPRWGYLIPALSLALSLPPLLITLSLSALAAFHALTGYNFPISTPPFRSDLGFTALVCYVVFGPVLAFIVCVGQRARAEQMYGSDLLLGYRMKRLNTIALQCSALAIGVMMLILFLALLLRMGT